MKKLSFNLFDLYYDDKVSVAKFNYRISGYRRKNPGTLEDNVKDILERAIKTLGPEPKMSRFNIQIFKTQKRLNQEIKYLFGVRNKKRVHSFYLHKKSTVYMVEREVRRWILGHELAHRVIDYSCPLLTTAAKEALAQYAEAHFDD